MKIGLLICGDTPSPMHRQGVTSTRILKQWLDPALPDSTSFRVFRVHAGKLPTRVDACDCYFVSGSDASLVDRDAWSLALCKFLLVAAKAQVPVVGLGFGHQALAQALGGRVARTKQWCLGAHTWKIVREEGWLRECSSKITLLCSNIDQVAKLPPRSVRLAASESCANGLFRIANHAVGIQGHPELDPATLEALLASHASRHSAEELAAARESLATPTQGKDMARWCANFVIARV